MLSPRVFATGFAPESLEAFFAGLDAPRYRAGQLLNWLYKRGAASFEEMTDFPKALRGSLAGEIVLSSVTEAKRQEARDGTAKALLRLYDERTIETVLLPSRKGSYTVCVSVQVGCPVGCPFCATGLQGFERNLLPAEIVDQVLYFKRYLGERGAITNLVFMGMGEPLANYDNLLQALVALNAPWGLGLGARNLTISTAGLVAGINRLAREKLQLGLAISLHASNDVLRSKLVPLNRQYPLAILLEAARRYVALSGRRVSFEYCLFDGVNDSLLQARELAYLLRGLNAHVNLIAASDVGTSYLAPSRERILGFEVELRRLGVNVTLRRSYGREIAAGCGQLKSAVNV
ncbi:MAG: 23S rRNA (adenine(2503)-C(2))-methyltransferase RlmN [Dehalococcoidia bacterium]|nr:23S rRNA (adenine(2503)-C(2))-methyltransferase RlmN [Dehalococcoidia bacterium]